MPQIIDWPARPMMPPLTGELSESFRFRQMGLDLLSENAAHSGEPVPIAGLETSGHQDGEQSGQEQ
jgi:hypothetical protein